MRAASPALKAFLAARTPCWKADLFTFTLLDGTVLRWGSFPREITVSGQTWSGPKGPKISCNRLTITNTTEVPEMEMQLLCGPNDMLEGRSLKAQIANGLFDGATIEMDSIVMPINADLTKPLDTSLGLVLMFIGRQSTADITAASVTMKAKGDNVLMNQYAPKNVYQTGCLHTFCDPGCTLSAAAFTFGNSVGAGSTNLNIVWGSIPGNTALFNLGKITMTSGVAAGQVRSIKKSTNAGIIPSYAFDDTPAPGDTFKVLQGCDRTVATCTLYSNLQHYRGFPYVPQVELGV
jgi:uncharacterized phage protein (TIGR02218 family)